MSYVTRACGGNLRHAPPDALAKGIASDSRAIRPGELFFALAGERFDGHDFVTDVTKRGAIGAVVKNGRWPADATGAAIEVDDPRAALARLAGVYRAEFQLPVVAVGGSNGKTTTKDLIASVARQRFPTLSSEASFNNDLGVSLSLLRLDATHAVAVLEVGTNHPGEIKPLAQMIRPRYGVVTSIGREHLEFFHDLKGVATEEGWLAELLPADGRLFVNADSAEMSQVMARTSAPITTVGIASRADWMADEIRVDETGTRFKAIAPSSALSGEYQTRLLGRHQVTNALLALAVGAELGLGREELRSGLLACQPPKYRMQAWEHGGARVLDDTYNANADSMNAALQTLMDYPASGRRIAVLGDMGELGEASEAAHAEVGSNAAKLGVQRLFAVGRMAGVMAGAARAAGLGEVETFAEVAPAAEAVRAFARPGDVILIKASRFMRLERVGAALRGQLN